MYVHLLSAAIYFLLLAIHKLLGKSAKAYQEIYFKLECVLPDIGSEGNKQSFDSWSNVSHTLANLELFLPQFGNMHLWHLYSPMTAAACYQSVTKTVPIG